MKNKRFNIIDFLSLVIIALFIVLALLVLRQPKPQFSEKVDLTLRVLTDKNSILNEVEKQKTVYYNTVNSPVKVVKVEKINTDLFITLEASGSTENGRYVFNGQRVNVGQKGEIHSTYYAQGRIINVGKAN